MSSFYEVTAGINQILPHRRVDAQTPKTRSDGYIKLTEQARYVKLMQ